MEEVPGIIKKSSYFVEDEEQHTATFYSFDGEELAIVSYNESYIEIMWKLDPNAPKPRPACMRIVHWEGSGKETDVPGHFAEFYDKNDNTIVSIRCSDSPEPTRAEWDRFEEYLDVTVVKG